MLNMGKGWTTSCLAFMKSLPSCRSFDSKHAHLLLLVAVTWTCCLSSVSSKDERNTVAFPLVPEFGTFAPDKRLALWQLPEGPVEKVLVIFIGRYDHPTSFWDYSPSCLTCIGRPEKRQIVADALSRNYAVFIPDRISSEWDPWPEDNADVLSCKAAITEWKNLLGLQGLPTMGIGISCGGWILSTVALTPGFFDAICMMISAATSEVLEAFTAEFPPTMFVQMPRDTRIATQIPAIRRSLESKGVFTVELKWYPHPLTPDWFSNSIIGLDQQLSASIFDCIKGVGWLDEENYLTSYAFLTGLPNELEATLRQCNVLDTAVGVNEAITDEIDIAYGYHIPISRFDDEIFAFFYGTLHSVDKSSSSF